MGQDQQAVAGALEEIVVTARRREEALMDTPLSITAFTGDELASRRIRRSHEIADATPNLVYRNMESGNNSAGIVFIRGIGQAQSAPTLQPGVGTYVDGVYISNIQGALVDLADIESVSVLRGPQGTLFGRNTVGGALQITTVKPGNELQGDVELELGEINHRELRATVNVPFTDRFYGRFTALSREQDGYIDTVNIPDDDEGTPGDDTDAFRVALRWMPTDALTIDWTYDTTQSGAYGDPIVLKEIFPQSGPSPQNNFQGSSTWQYNNIVAPVLGLPPVDEQFAAGTDNYVSYANFFVPSDNDIDASTLTVEWDIGENLTFKSISNYREQESIYGQDGDVTPASFAHFLGEMEGWQRSQEFQLLGTALGGRLNWVAGLYHFEEDMLNIENVQFPFFHAASGSHVLNKSNAVFGQFTYDINDRVSLTVGLRNTDEKFDSVVDDNIQYVTALFCAPGSPNNPPACAAGGPGFGGYLEFPPNTVLLIPKGVTESDESRTEPYVNLAYHFTDDLMGYVSYAEGFKGGGFTQRVPFGVPPFVFGPEYAEVWEVGTKWTGWDNRLRLTAALFATDYLDMQVPATGGLGQIFVNAGDSEINGGELELTLAATDRLTLSMGAGRLDAKYVALRELDLQTQTVEIDMNDRVPDAPDWQTNASIMYRMPLARGELVARLDHTYSDSYFVNAQNHDGSLVPSLGVFHGGLTYFHNSDRWEVNLHARNLTDEFRVVEIRGSPTGDGRLMQQVMPPRQARLSFKYRF